MVPGETICMPIYDLKEHQRDAGLARFVLQACTPLYDHKCSPNWLASKRPARESRVHSIFRKQALSAFRTSICSIEAVGCVWQVGYHMCTSVAGAALLGLPFAMGLLGEHYNMPMQTNIVLALEHPGDLPISTCMCVRIIHMHLLCVQYAVSLQNLSSRSLISLYSVLCFLPYSWKELIICKVQRVAQRHVKCSSRHPKTSASISMQPQHWEYRLVSQQAPCAPQYSS